MTALLDRIRGEAARLGLEGKTALVALSGGPDSMALLRLLLELRTALQLTLVAGHLDHGLRGEQSARDAQWVREECRRLEVGLEQGRIDVPAEGAAAGLGIEESARAARYRFLESAASRRGCSHIAVAHTADDQAETVLHHILRGTGLAGLRGIPQTRTLESGIVVVRPMLGVSRREIQKYLAQIGQHALSDESNLDTSFTRNRIRHVLMPLLRSEFNPNVDDALQRLAGQAADVQHAVETIAAQILDAALVQVAANTCTLDGARLRDQPGHLLREGFRLLWQRMHWPRQRMDASHWERLAQLACEPGACDLPEGISARRRKNLLEIARNEPAS